MNGGDFSNSSLLDLFRIETEGQVRVLTAGLLALEREPANEEQLEACMRAAHSLKGAARIVDRDLAVRVAHAMEDVFVAAGAGRLTLAKTHVDRLLVGVDLLSRIAAADEPALAALAAADEAGRLIAQLSSCDGDSAADPAPLPVPEPPAEAAAPAAAEAGSPGAADRVLRVSSDQFNRLLGSAGESLIASRWLKPFSESLLRLHRVHQELSRDLDRVRDALSDLPNAGTARIAHADARRRLHECTLELTQRMGELDVHDRRTSSVSRRLYDEALAMRMRPFSDGLDGLARMVRDVSHALGKDARLEVLGGDTAVDRDILEQLQAPLVHLLRNAVDHGVEAPAERTARGKNRQSTLKVQARHRGGRLQITVSDDGRGVDLPQLRRKIVTRQLTDEATAARLSEPELLEFLFLPGVSLREAVSEVSGRGVGLDIVQTVVRHLRGTTRVTTRPGRGTTFQLELPLTLSILRALLVEVAGEPYAIPLASMVRAVKLAPGSIATLEGRPHFEFRGERVSLVSARQMLGVDSPRPASGDLPVVIIGDGGHCMGIAVDRLMGERELVVQPLDGRVGKVKDIAAAALMEDGAPVLIFDPEDALRSAEQLVRSGSSAHLTRMAPGGPAARRKRVLIVDDSLTVRELERKLLEGRGYAIEVAVDGMDGWNAARARPFDLVVTDVDMPRLDGIELVTLIRRDPKLKSLPVMIVSYKDREADRQRGLDAGADYYLTKGSFHDETLLNAVVDLIGPAQA
jgi:two-component system sensor histidine kinase and response regulator WspE